MQVRVNQSQVVSSIKSYVGPLLKHTGVYLPKYPSSLRGAIDMVKGRRGLEIGGPSDFFRFWNSPLPIYDKVGALDNCDFSRDTRWAAHQNKFFYHPRKESGLTIFTEGSHLDRIAKATYDFVLSCHNLEHFANPVKALKEWQRVVRPSGGLVLVLPHFKDTFDHRRPLTPVAHMLEDFERSTGEDDLTHLPEILENHDLALDPGAGLPEQFHARSLKNAENRCLHHHTFDERNSRELLSALGLRVLSVENVAPCHLILLAQFPN